MSRRLALYIFINSVFKCGSKIICKVRIIKTIQDLHVEVSQSHRLAHCYCNEVTFEPSHVHCRLVVKAVGLSHCIVSKVIRYPQTAPDININMYIKIVPVV